MSEKLFKKLVVSTLLLLVAPVLALLGLDGRMKELKGQLAQARKEREGYLERLAEEKGTSLRLKEQLTQAQALLEELVDVTSVTFSEYGEQMRPSETALHEARERAERSAKLLKAIRAFLAQSKAEGKA